MLNFIGLVVTAALMMVVAKALITFTDFSRVAKMPDTKMSRPFSCSRK
jgi:hypothetical protein